MVSCAAGIAVAHDTFERHWIGKLCARYVDLQQRCQDAAVSGDQGTNESARPVYQLKRVDNLLPKVVELRQNAVDRTNRAPDRVKQSSDHVVDQGYDRSGRCYYSRDALSSPAERPP